MKKRRFVKQKKNLKKQLLAAIKKINTALEAKQSNIRLYLIRAGNKYKITDNEGYLLDFFIKKNIVITLGKDDSQQPKELGNVYTNIIEITDFLINNIQNIKLNKPYYLITDDGAWAVKKIYYAKGETKIIYCPAIDKFPLIITDKEYAENIVSSSDKKLKIKEYVYKS